MGLMTVPDDKPPSECYGPEWCKGQIANYKAILYHDILVRAGQAKGLKRQAAKIKRLKQRIKELEWQLTSWRGHE